MQQALFEPESNWKCPDPVRDFPDLRGCSAKRFGTDSESKDLGLKEHGAGWIRGHAKVTVSHIHRKRAVKLSINGMVRRSNARRGKKVHCGEEHRIN
jgi:ribosomal protein L27